MSHQPTGACDTCRRLDVPTRNGRLCVHRKVKGDRRSAYCSGFGLDALPSPVVDPEATTANLPDGGFKWVRGLISNPKSWTLLDPNGNPTAHVYRCDDRTWAALWDDGLLIADGLSTCGVALRRVDDVARPCAYVDTDPSHGIVPCDNDREPGSPYCAPHRAKVEKEEAIPA